MKKCSNCNSVVVTGAKFCSECGATAIENVATTSPRIDLALQTEGEGSNVKTINPHQMGQPNVNNLPQMQNNQDPLSSLYARACSFYEGNGVAKDYAQAFELFMEAAVQGHAQSQLKVASMYDSGQAVASNPEKSHQWYSKAAAQGLGEGYYYVGLGYLIGDGTEQSDVKAKEAFEKAINAGYSNANSCMGDIYYRGLAVIKDMRIAAEYYLKGALGGDCHGELELGNLYYDGNGVPKDIDLAITWYKKSADGCHEVAQYLLARLYFELDEYRDPKQAIEFAKMSAAEDSDYPPAQTLLGKFYHLGFGVACDVELAKYWLNEAISRGDEDAAAYLRQIESELQGSSDDEDEFDDDVDDDEAQEEIDDGSEDDQELSDEMAEKFDSLMEQLDLCIYELDGRAYESEGKIRNYFDNIRLANELHTKIHSKIANAVDWTDRGLWGLLVEDPLTADIVEDDEGDILLSAFQGKATAVYYGGTVAIELQNGIVNFLDCLEFEKCDPSELRFWTTGEVVYLGNQKKNTRIWGGVWTLREDHEIGVDRFVDANVEDANICLDQIFAIRKGEWEGDMPFDAADNSDEDSDCADAAEEVLDDSEITLSDGSKWSGELDANGMVTGFGVWTWENGDRYEGFCLGGYLHGQGAYIWSNGSLYEGGWQRGVRHGYGINITSEGTRTEGEWKEGIAPAFAKTTSFASEFLKAFKDGYEGGRK